MNLLRISIYSQALLAWACDLFSSLLQLTIEVYYSYSKLVLLFDESRFTRLMSLHNIMYHV